MNIDNQKLILDTKAIQITDFLRRLGHSPVRDGATYALFSAPYRTDRNPSLKVDKKRNRWCSNCKIQVDGVSLIVPYDIKFYANNQLVGVGSIKKSFEINFPIECSKELVRAQMFAHSAEFMVNAVPGQNYNLKLEYSRAWGTISFKQL